MVYVDASFYIALLNKKEENHALAMKLIKNLKNKRLITAQIILGEVLTVGSMRVDKKKTIKYVEAILNGNTHIIYETPELIKKAFSFFKQIPSKNISWADCFSFAAMHTLGIKQVLSFDKDFKKYRDFYSS